MKKYFKYELRKNAYTIGCITLVIALIYLTPLLTASKDYLIYSVSLGEMSFIGGVLAVCLPIWLFVYRTKRRSVDMFYSLPLSHTKIFITRYLLGLVMLYVPYTVAYWLGALVVIGKINSQINAVWYIPQYFASLIPIYCLYAISAFAFTRANRAKDGAMFIIFWIFAAAMAVFVILYLFADFTSFYYSNYFLPFSPLDTATSYFQLKLTDGKALLDGLIDAEPSYAAMAVGFSVTALTAIGSTVGIALTEKYAKAENAGQLSESWFGYRVMIPYYTVCILSLMPLGEPLFYIFIVLVIVGAYLTTAAYRRTLKIGKKQTIILAASILAGMLLSLIFSAINAFEPDYPVDDVVACITTLLL